MSGTRTFKNGPHPSSVGEFVQPLALQDADWKRLEKIIGRALIQEERAMISGGLENLRHIAQVLSSNKVSAQDVKETLLAIGGEKDDDQVRRAVNDCDSISRGLIDGALYAMGECENFDDKNPNVFRAAALLAAKRFKGANGNPGVLGRANVYTFALCTWRDLGRTDMAVWETDGKATPLVEFATALLAQVETSPPGYSVVAKDLRKVSA